MLIAQISDIHCRPPGQRYKDIVDSNQALRNAIAHLDRLDRRPDLVLVTGDLTDFGQPGEFESAHRILSGLQLPVYVMPGNHDDRGNFRAAFAADAYLSSDGPVNFCVDDYPVRIIAIDSCVPGAHHGELGVETLDWLERHLNAAPQKPTIIALHHPPFVSGIPYMDQYRCLQADELGKIISRFTCIEAVVCGHVHRFMMRRWAGTVVCCAPSTATEIALKLQPGASPQSYLGPPGMLLHWWSPPHGLVSHLSLIGDFPGPFDFF